MRRMFLLLAVATALSAADVYRVAGVIIDSETGSPVANASVALSPGGESRGDMGVITGPDGRFSFDAPRGIFRLSAVVAGHSQVFGEMSPFSDAGIGVVTGPDEDTAHLVFRWFRPAVITGRVLDDQGEPVENARVKLLHYGVADGRTRIGPRNEASTNDRGEYRIWEIPAASYYLIATGRPWYAEAWAVGPGKPQAPVAYRPVYYPGTADVTHAAPLTVHPGEEAHADFAFSAVAAANVTVNCDNNTSVVEALPAAPNGAMTLSVIGQSIGGEAVLSQTAFIICPFTVNGVLPGHYLLRLSDTEAAGPRAAQRWVDVGVGDIEVSLSLHPAAALSGRVTLKNAGAWPNGLLVGLFRDLDNWSETMPIGADGSFSVPHVEPGKYLVSVSGAGYYAETIRAGDVALPRGVVNIEDGAELRLSIVASNKSVRFRGFATRDDQPLGNMLVVIVPRDPVSAYSNQGYQTDSDGSFDWPALPAGDYLLFAVDDPTIAYADPETVKPYLSQAKQIRIEPGKVLEERVPVQAVVK